MSYSQCIQQLFCANLFGGVKLGLDVCHRLNGALGYPDRRFEAIHVAGTNGKGSVTKKISVALEHAGYRTGLFTSPHISCFRERICVNGRMISEDDVIKHLNRVFRLAEAENLRPTFFELTTLLALDYFAAQNVDIAVFEVGLGGRLDATNIINPKLSVITSISLEHTEILGSTIEEIALEKAGIIKPGIPVLLGQRLPQQLLCDVANARQSPCMLVKGSFPNFEEENNAIAQAAIQFLGLSENSLKAGLSSHMPCRLEIFTPQQLHNCGVHPFPQSVILDVAHNPDGLLRLFEAIHQQYPQPALRVICGLSKTKDIPGCLSIVSKHAQHIHLVEAPNGRGAPIELMHSTLAHLKFPKDSISIHGTIADTVKHALIDAADHNQLLVACGSFFIMSTIRAALGICEPTDPIDLNERWQPKVKDAG